MKNYLSELARSLKPYTPGEQPKDKKYIKLNTNENPYPPSKLVGKAIEFETEDLRLYPDPEATALRESLAKYYGLKADQIFVGNGSDEVLAFAFPAFFSGGTVLFPDITYSFYPIFAGLFATAYQEVPLKKDFALDPSDYFPENRSEMAKNPSGILIANPNAPTGRYLPLGELEKIILANPETVVLVDEAYVDFGGESATSLINTYDNLLVVMTLSKSRSLAGLRIGFALGNPHLIEGLSRIKNSFNSYTIDRLAMAGAIFAIEDEAYFQETRHKIMKTRETVAEKLEAMGFQVIPSRANFLFVRHQNKAAKDLFNALRDRGILVRYFDKPLIDAYLRITIGTEAEMKTFIGIIGELTGFTNGDSTDFTNGELTD